MKAELGADLCSDSSFGLLDKVNIDLKIEEIVL